MPTTPHLPHYSDRDTPALSSQDHRPPVTSTERKEFTINPTNSSDSHPEDEPATASHHDNPHCPCGALADRNGLCRKCQARAIWDRRQANRARRAIQRPSSSRRTGRDSGRPRGRRPGR